MDQNKDLSFAKIVLMWSIILFGYFLSIFHSLTTAILQPYLMEEFKLDASGITNMGSMFFYAYLCMQIPTGLLADKLGPRTTAFGGLIVATVGAVCFASASSVFFLYLGRALIGLGISTIFVCVLKFQVAFMHPNIITTMTGIACFVGTLGGIVAQSPLAYMVETFGWRSTVFGIGCVSFINALLVFFVVANSPPKKLSMENSETQSQAQTPKSDVGIVKALFSIIFDWRTWPPIMVYAVFYGTYVVLMGYSGTSWLENTYNISVMQASSYLIIGVVGCAIACVVIGVWSDRIHNRKLPLLVVGVFYTLCWFVLAYFSDGLSLAMISVLLFCIGFFSCAYVLSFSFVQEINPTEFSGIAGSVVNMGGYLGPVFLPMLFVFIQNSHENIHGLEAYTESFTYMFYAVGLCFLFSLLAQEPSKVKKK